MCHEIITIEIKGAHVQIVIRYIGVLTTLYVMYDMVVKGYIVTRTCTCRGRRFDKPRVCSLMWQCVMII